MILHLPGCIFHHKRQLIALFYSGRISDAHKVKRNRKYREYSPDLPAFVKYSVFLLLKWDSLGEKFGYNLF